MPTEGTSSPSFSLSTINSAHRRNQHSDDAAQEPPTLPESITNFDGHPSLSDRIARTSSSSPPRSFRPAHRSSSPTSSGISDLPMTPLNSGGHYQNGSNEPPKPGLSSWASRSNPPPPKSTLNASKPGNQNMLHAWWWEVGSCVLAVAALMAIVATLYTYRGRPLPQLPFGISVNALISIYSVILRGALVTIFSSVGQLKWTWFESDRPLHDLQVFDEASRGTLGSLALIWRVHFRQAVASVGAILTVLLIAVDPFTQQLVHYVGCSDVVSDQIATLPRAHYFQERGIHTAAGSSSINTDVQTAINAGVFASGTAIDVSCPTGNCTFSGEYGTVGYCSFCRDISHRLQFDQVCYNSSGSANSSKPIKCTNDSAYNLTSSIRDGIDMTSVGQGGGPDLARMSYVEYYEPTDIQSGVQILVGKTGWSISGISPGTGDIIPGCKDAASNNTWRCRQYGAAFCDLHPCVRTYTARMSAGVLHEEQISQSPYDQKWGLDDAGAYQAPFVGNPTWGMVDLKCVNPSERRFLIRKGYAINPNDRWLAYNITFNVSQQISPSQIEEFPYSLLAHNCMYTMDSLFTSSLWSDYLPWFFQSTINGSTPYGYTSPVTLIQGPQVLQTIYNYGKVDFERIDSIFQNMSRSLTNHIRQNGNTNRSAPVTGQVHHYATCLEVQWGWIAFLAALVGGGIVFLCALLVSTRLSRAMLWKNSALATVFHGPFVASEHGPPEKGHGSGVGDAAWTIQGMEASAKNLIVRLDEQLGRLKVSESQVKSNGRG